MTKPFALSTTDPRFSPTEPVTVNGYLYQPMHPDGRSPEHQMIDLCRQLRDLYPEIKRITFRVDREDGEWQSADFGRREDTDGG